MKRTIGFYLGILAAVAGIAAFILYLGTPNSILTVSVLVVIAVLVEAAAAALCLREPKRLCNAASIVTSTLFAAALVSSFSSQMNQLGSVVSGLDEASTLQSFFLFVGVTAAAMLLSIVSGFTGRAK